MSRWLLLSLAASGFVSRVAAVPSSPISRRDDDSGLNCQSSQACVSWYVTGGALCASGYEKFKTQTAVQGSYCERKCTDDESKQCTAGKCYRATEACNTFPASESCGDALKYCGGPIKMDEGGCKPSIMKQPVAYNSETMTCDVSDRVQDDAHVLRLSIEAVNAEGDALRLSCAPVTTADIAKIQSVVVTKQNTACAKRDRYATGKEYEQLIECPADISNFDAIEKAVGAACAKATHADSPTPVFTSSRDKNGPQPRVDNGQLDFGF